MKSKSLILLVLSVGFGIVAAVGISQVMKNQSIADDGAAAARGPVLLATGTLDMRTPLTEENVKIENWPVSIIPPDAVTSFEEVNEMVTLTRLSQGMPIIKTAIQHKSTATTPPIGINMKVVAVRVSADDTIGNLLNPGDKVDVIGIFKKRNPATNLTTTESLTFLKALRVYSIGNKTTAESNEQGGNENASSIVGLLVTEKQSEALVFVQDTGKIKLVLRGDTEENTGEVGPLEDLDKLAAEKAAVPKLEKLNTVMDIWLGDEVITTEIKDGKARQNKGSSKKESDSDSESDEMSERDDFDDRAESGDRGNSRGRGGRGGREDSDRGIGGDKYRGE